MENIFKGLEEKQNNKDKIKIIYPVKNHPKMKANKYIFHLN